MKSMRVRESEIQKAILQYLHARGIFAWTNKTTGTFDPYKKTFRKFTGLRGVSDVLGVMPNGRFLAIEVKAKDGRVSPDQKSFIEQINKEHGLAFVARSVADVEKVFSGYFSGGADEALD